MRTKLERPTAGVDSVQPRRLRFSLRTLLLFTLLISFPLAWLAHCSRKAYRVRSTMQAIHELGGKVHLWSSGRFLLAGYPHIAFIDFPATSNFSDDHIPLLRALGNLHGLSLRNTKISRDGLSQLKSLPGLQRLDLRSTLLDDAAATSWIREIEGLEFLDVRDTSISDVALEAFAKIASLRGLHVSGHRISDDGILKLRGHMALEYLDVSDTGITDRGIVVALALPQLQTLLFARTSVSNTGLKAIQVAPRLNLISISGSQVRGDWQSVLRAGVSWRPSHVAGSNRVSDIFHQ